jgi:hypothetical protein
VGSLQGTIQDVQTVLRGGQEPGAIDWSDPYRALGVTQVKDKVKDQQNLARATLNVKDATLQDDAAQKVFNVTFAEGEKLLRELASAKLKVEPGPTVKQKKDLDEYNKHLAESVSLLDKLQEGIAHQWIVQVNETIAVINNVAAAAKAAFQSVLGLGRKTQELSQPPSRDVSQSTRDILSEHETEVHASGGYVRGGGSGTSDSILARLSNGEFVINAGSARRLGAPFLQRLNRYASGGNVGGGLDYDPGGSDFTGGAPDWRVDRPVLSTHERSVLWAAYNKWRAGPGGRLLRIADAETDAEYFKRTGFHYGPRPGEKPLASGRDYARDTPLASGRDYARETSLGLGPGLPGPARDREGHVIVPEGRGVETDAQYFARTGFHYGPRRPGSGPSDDAAYDAALRSLGITPQQMQRLRERTDQLMQGLDPSATPSHFSGGLITAPPIRFAEGGSVGSVSGTPVHLHIGGGTYPMSANSGVAAALVGAAKHSQMVSSGIKPSWYGR